MFFCNPRLLFCFGLAWLVTNGWSYILLGIGTYFQIGWMIAVSGTYLAFLWLPITVEKPVTIAISIILLRFLFPNDEKTLAVLRNMSEKIKESAKGKKKKKKHTSADDNNIDEGDLDKSKDHPSDDEGKKDNDGDVGDGE